MAFVRRLLFKFWYLLAAFIIFFGFLASVAHLLTPYANNHLPEIEKFVANTIQLPVKLESVSIDWRRFSPQISLYKVTVYDQTTQQPKVAIGGIRVNFSIWKTLWYRKPYVTSITVAGIALKINQEDPNVIKFGEITSVNVKDAFTNANVEPDAMVKWIFTQPRLALQNIQITYTYKYLPERSVTLRYLSLRNNEDTHVVRGNARLNQTAPTDIKISLDWDGDVRNLVATRAHLHLNLNNFSISEWLDKFFFYGVSFQQGVGDAELWMDWKNNQVTNVQCDFEVNGLKLISNVTHHENTLALVQGNITWAQKNNSQEITGTEVQINFPDHHWAPTNFDLNIVSDANGNYKLTNLKIGYFDLTDALSLLFDTTLLPDNIKSPLSILAPKGEILNLETDLNDSNVLQDQDFSTINFKATLKNLSFHHWQNYPAVKNLSGDISWDGTQAKVTLESKNIMVDIPQVFIAPLNFEYAKGYAELWNHQGTWMLAVDSLHAENKFMNGETKFSISLPTTQLPSLDLTGTVQVNDVRAIKNYLPLSSFSKDLSAWLQDAFVAGSANNFSIVVQGQLADFPFDKNPGKFQITGNIKNLELNYATGWPHLYHLDGTLTFAGAQMTADVDSGEVMGVPLSNIQAKIPYIGSQDYSVLTVGGNIAADLRQALNFIKASPLKDSIGRQFDYIDITGPMKMRLDLTIPLSKPEDTTLLGVVNINKALVNMPLWKLSLENLTGDFQFTEKSLQASNMQGVILNSPATINIVTQLDNTSAGNNIIRLDLTSALTVATLQDRLGVKIDNIAQGKTNYLLQLFIPTSGASQSHVLLTTDLNGISINAPQPFGKSANTTVPLSVDVILKVNPLQMRISYGKVLSAALNLAKQRDHLEFTGGEVRFGGGDATFSNASGILVTGKLPIIDVAMWQKYFASIQPEKNHQSNSENLLKSLRGLDIATDQLIMPAMTLHRVSLKGNYASGGWNVNGSSDEISGGATIPANLKGKIQANIQQLNLNNFATNLQSRMDPRQIPDLSLDVNNVRYNDFRINHFVINTARTASGMTIESLTINDGAINLDAKGSWEYRNGNSSSHLDGKFTTTNITNALHSIGFQSSNLIGTNANATFNLDWNGSPYGADLRTLNGTISIKLGPGSIIHLSEASNAKLGLGRLLNVLSLSSLPSTMSSSRTFDQGYVFETMQADFQIQNGNLMTQDMQFNGPIAGVSVKGRIGLPNEDLDLRLSVTPYVTGSLPVVAALAGGPIAGIGAMLVDKMISAANIITYHYNVTGSWSNPNWQAQGTEPAQRPTH